jgi:hypothetical protein
MTVASMTDNVIMARFGAAALLEGAVIATSRP